MTTCRRTNRVFATLCSALLLNVLAGCGGSDLELFPGGGSVTYQGKAVGSANVTFQPVNAGDGISTAQGQTDADGKFTLQTTGNDGIMKGRFNVTVSAQEAVDLSNLTAEEKTNKRFQMMMGETPEPTKHRIPPEYGNVALSGLQFEVTGDEEEGANFDIVLKEK